MAVKDLEAPRSRIVIRAEDFGTWIVEDVKWNWGLEAIFYETTLTKVHSSANGIISTSLLSNSRIDFSEIEKEKEKGKENRYFFSFISRTSKKHSMHIYIDLTHIIRNFEIFQFLSLKSWS